MAPATFQTPTDPSAPPAPAMSPLGAHALGNDPTAAPANTDYMQAIKKVVPQVSSALTNFDAQGAQATGPNAQMPSPFAQRFGGYAGSYSMPDFVQNWGYHR